MVTDWQSFYKGTTLTLQKQKEHNTKVRMAGTESYGETCQFSNYFACVCHQIKINVISNKIGDGDHFGGVLLHAKLMIFTKSKTYSTNMDITSACGTMLVSNILTLACSRTMTQSTPVSCAKTAWRRKRRMPSSVTLHQSLRTSSGRP